MNLKWQNKKVTIMIIPEANRSVVRLRIRNVYAYAAIFTLSALLLLTLTIYFQHMRTLTVTYELKNQLVGANQQLDQTTTMKNQAIEQLQSEIIQLSEQTDLMKTKIEEMKQLNPISKRSHRSSLPMR